MGEIPHRGKEKKYSLLKARLALCGFVLPLAAAAIFHFFLSYPIWRYAVNLTDSPGAAYPVYVLAFFLFVYFFLLPLRFFSSFTVEKKFGLSTRAFTSWLKDEAKSALLTLALWVVSILFFYAAIYYFPAGWWAVSAFAWISFSVALSFLAPVLIVPMFLKYLPIDSNELRERISGLAERTGVRVQDICRVDLSKKTLKANAALMGIGKTRKVVLADTLTGNFTPEEVESVAAHEFGHHKLKHIPRLLVFSSALALLGFWVLYLASGAVSAFAGTDGILDVRTLPVIFFFAQFVEILIVPVRNFFSRRLEREADIYAIETTSRPGTFIDALRKLARMNFAEPAPSVLRKIFLYSHPPISERIAMARKRIEERRPAD